MNESSLYQTSHTDNVNDTVEPGLLDDLEGFFSKMVKSIEESLQRDEEEEEEEGKQEEINVDLKRKMIIKLKEEVSKLTGDNEGNIDKLNEYQNTHEDLRKRIKDFEEKVADVEEENETLEEERNTLQSENEELLVSQATMQKENKELFDQNMNLKRTLREFKPTN